MNLLLNDILHLTDEEIKNCKIELNMQPGDSDETYLDRWLTHSDIEKSTATCKECSFWGWGKSWGNDTPNYKPGQLAFSFLRMNNADEWLFVSAGRIVDIPKDDYAKVEIMKKYASLFGRLVIKCKKGNTYSRYVFNLEKYIDTCIVKEILPTVYDGDEFPGYDKVCLSYDKLKTIINRGKRDWIAALENQKAVYLLTDKETGKLYVGSAYGENGMLLQRWKNYIANGHGGNVELENLSFEYIKKNFQYSILENYNSRVDKHIILKRESWWKKCLYSKERGYNGN